MAAEPLHILCQFLNKTLNAFLTQIALWLRQVSVTTLAGMVFFVSFLIGLGWRKIPCLLNARLSTRPFLNLRCNKITTPLISLTPETQVAQV